MSENKYHLSRNGFMTKCSATKRACPLGGVHYTQEQYDQLASENDARIRLSAVKPDPNSYYGKAQAAYVESVQRLKRFDKATAETKKYEQSLLKEHGLETAYSFKTQEEVQKTLSDALLYARDVYVEEGVSYAKASFIIQDMKANLADPTKPITKRRDRMDEQIAAKTKNAKERLNEDSKYAELTKAYGEAVRKDRLASDVSQKVARFRTNLIRETNANGMPNLTEQKALERAKTWMKAGIAPSAREVATTTVTPDKVSIGPDGKINNVWVETSNGIEKVVGYRGPKYERSSGALITENGTEVSSFTHYHSYKADSGGIKDVIIADKNGPSYPAESFSLYMSWDSGD
jgi:hypothetical protein